MSRIQWALSPDQRDHLVDLLDRACRAKERGNHETYNELCDRIRRIPGFPLGTNIQQDEIEVVVKRKPTSIIHLN
jgi:hypothetical protein